MIKDSIDTLKEHFDEIKERFPVLANEDVFKIMELNYLRQIALKK